MILIKNIYYMLSYAFHVLKELGIREVDVEQFDNVQKLCAEILIKGVNTQIKRGLGRDYVLREEKLSSIKGKIDVTASLKTESLIRRQLVCSYDDFSVNTQLNQILKSTLLLLNRAEIKNTQKKEIKKILVFFSEVDEIDVHSIDWNLNYNRSNQSYQLLITVCYFAVKGLLHTQSNGTHKVSDFLDEQRMSRLYEKFVLEYYRRHFPEMSVNASQIAWQLDNDVDDMLPVMQSDILIQKGTQILIIDAKYYSHNTQVQFDKHSIHSGNLYQIFTYVKNKDYELRDKPHEVSGVLLYAKTDEEIQPDAAYMMSGNRISVKTLDLNTDFSTICDALDTVLKDNINA